MRKRKDPQEQAQTPQTKARKAQQPQPVFIDHCSMDISMGCCPVQKSLCHYISFHFDENRLSAIEMKA